MKKHLKICLAILFSAVLALNSVSVMASNYDDAQEMSTVENGENYEELQSSDSEDLKVIEVVGSSTLNEEKSKKEDVASEETEQEIKEYATLSEEKLTEDTRIEETVEEKSSKEVTEETTKEPKEETTDKTTKESKDETADATAKDKTIDKTTKETTEEDTSEASVENSEEASVSIPEFSGYKIIDGVAVLVTAPEGVFPEGSTLWVGKLSNEEQQYVDNAVDKTRNNNVNVAVSYTYDIKVLNNEYYRAWEHPFSRLRACCFSPNFSYLGAPYKHNI